PHLLPRPSRVVAQAFERPVGYEIGRLHVAPTLEGDGRADEENDDADDECGKPWRHDLRQAEHRRREKRQEPGIDHQAARHHLGGADAELAGLADELGLRERNLLPEKARALTREIAEETG